MTINLDGPVKSRIVLFFIIPAQAGIHKFQIVIDSRLRGSDTVYDFLLDHQPLVFALVGDLVLAICCFRFIQVRASIHDCRLRRRRFPR